MNTLLISKTRDIINLLKIIETNIINHVLIKIFILELFLGIYFYNILSRYLFLKLYLERMILIIFLKYVYTKYNNYILYMNIPKTIFGEK